MRIHIGLAEALPPVFLRLAFRGGYVLPVTGSMVVRFGFRGEQWDADTRVDDLQFRVSDPLEDSLDPGLHESAGINEEVRPADLDHIARLRLKGVRLHPGG